MLKQDCPARTAIIFTRTGIISWMKVNWRKEIRTSVVPLVMVRGPNSICKKLFTTSVWAAI
jgi:hypothetical protein